MITVRSDLSHQTAANTIERVEIREKRHVIVDGEEIDLRGWSPLVHGDRVVFVGQVPYNGVCYSVKAVKDEDGDEVEQDFIEFSENTGEDSESGLPLPDPEIVEVGGTENPYPHYLHWPGLTPEAPQTITGPVVGNIPLADKPTPEQLAAKEEEKEEDRQSAAYLRLEHRLRATARTFDTARRGFWTDPPWQARGANALAWGCGLLGLGRRELTRTLESHAEALSLDALTTLIDDIVEQLAIGATWWFHYHDPVLDWASELALFRLHRTDKAGAPDTLLYQAADEAEWDVIRTTWWPALLKESYHKGE